MRTLLHLMLDRIGLRNILLVILIAVTSLGYAAKLEISLKHVFENEELILMEKQYNSPLDDQISFDKLKYYIGDIVLVYESGEKYTDGKRYHLIDAEQSETLLIQLDNIPEGTITNVEFGIGVDSLSNASGLMDGDLDPMNGMYWAWSSGFINFKLEGICKSCQTQKEFKYHIGGFIAPNETYQPTSIPVEKKMTNGKNKLDLIMNVGALFQKLEIEKTSTILSPSVKAKDFSEQLPKMWSIK